MFRKILVPSDLTDRTAKALEAAAGISKTDDAHVTVLHVIEMIDGADFDELASFYQKLEERGRKQLQELVSGARGLRGRVDIAIVYGKRADEVLRFAREKDIDLIVLASHPLDPSKPYAGMGTMSYKLGILAPCAVLLLK